MNKTDLLYLENQMRKYPKEQICITFKHDKCSKYSANLTELRIPIIKDLAKTLTNISRISTKRCVYCKKNVSDVSDIKFQIKGDVLEYLATKCNLWDVSLSKVY